MNDFRDVGYIINGAPDGGGGLVEIEDIIEFRYSRGVDPEPLEMIEGTFLWF
jgi:hypothetical protein